MAEKRKIWRVDANGQKIEVIPQINSANVDYDGSSADLEATNVQDAIDELKDLVEEAGKVDKITLTSTEENVELTPDSNKNINIATTSKYNASSNKVAMQNELNTKADKVIITGATKTKITYNSQGIVTAGADAGISDITGLQTALDAKVNYTDVINDIDSSATNKPLSANMGKELNDRINNLEARGKFLALWDSTTGKPESDPPEGTVYPYIYTTGDYFIVNKVQSTPSTSAPNYKPTGTSYTKGQVSTTVEDKEVRVNDTYYFDGTGWVLQVNHIDGTNFLTEVNYNSAQKELRYVKNGTVHTVKDENDDEVTFVNSVDGQTGVVDLSNSYLGKTATATDSDKLDGHHYNELVNDVTYDSSSRKIKKVKGSTTTDVVALSTVAISGSYNDLSNKPEISIADNQTGNVISNVSVDSTNKHKLNVSRLSAVVANSAITPGLATSVTYDSKGLITAGGNAFEWGVSGQTEPSDKLMANGIFLELVE